MRDCLHLCIYHRFPFLIRQILMHYGTPTPIHLSTPLSFFIFSNGYRMSTTSPKLTYVTARDRRLITLDVLMFNLKSAFYDKHIPSNMAKDFCNLSCCGYIINSLKIPAIYAVYLHWNWGNHEIALVPFKTSWWMIYSHQYQTTKKHNKAHTVGMILSNT